MWSGGTGGSLAASPWIVTGVEAAARPGMEKIDGFLLEGRLAPPVGSSDGAGATLLGIVGKSPLRGRLVVVFSVVEGVFSMASITCARAFCNSCTCASDASDAAVEALSNPSWPGLLLDGPGAGDARLSAALLSSSAIFACKARIMSWCASGPCSYASMVEDPAAPAAELLAACLFPFELPLVFVVGAGDLLAADVGVEVAVGSSDMVYVTNTGKHSCEVLGNGCSTIL